MQESDNSSNQDMSTSDINIHTLFNFNTKVLPYVYSSGTFNDITDSTLKAVHEEFKQFDGD